MMRMHWAVLAVVLVGPVHVAAQTPQATPLPPPNGDSIIQELRLLRQAIQATASKQMASNTISTSMIVFIGMPKILSISIHSVRR